MGGWVGGWVRKRVNAAPATETEKKKGRRGTAVPFDLLLLLACCVVYTYTPLFSPLLFFYLPFWSSGCWQARQSSKGSGSRPFCPRNKTDTAVCVVVYARRKGGQKQVGRRRPLSLAPSLSLSRHPKTLSSIRKQDNRVEEEEEEEEEVAYVRRKCR